MSTCLVHQVVNILTKISVLFYYFHPSKNDLAVLNKRELANIRCWWLHLLKKSFQANSGESTVSAAGDLTAISEPQLDE